MSDHILERISDQLDIIINLKQQFQNLEFTTVNFILNILTSIFLFFILLLLIFIVLRWRPREINAVTRREFPLLSADEQTLPLV